ncbi:MAG: DUF6562 domain-containing protein [Candidatus Limisoma sp.]
MKKILFYATALTMAMTSCQQEDFQMSIAENGEGNFNITIDAPEAMNSSRSYTLGAGDALYGAQSSSALGGLTNVDWSAYDLRYKVVVYQKNTISDGNFEYIPVLTRVETVDTYQSVSLSFRLTTNRTYRVVAWADFVTQGSTDDLHYDTSDLTNITCLDEAEHMLNDESRDAYFAAADYTIGADDISASIMLRRPFAKIRFVTTDWALDDLEMPDEFTLTYHNCTIYKGFDAVSSACVNPVVLGNADSSDVISCKGTINKNIKEYALNYDQVSQNRTVVVDYLFTPPATLNAIHMDLSPTGLATRSLDVDIPTRRNFLTTILGNFLTGSLTATFEVDELMRNEYNDYYLTAAEAFPAVEPAKDSDGAFLISSPNELVWLQQYLNSVHSHPSMTVKLVKDIDLEGYHWTPMNYHSSDEYDNLFNLLFDGQGHKVVNINIDASGVSIDKNVGFFSRINNGIVKNLTIENITINNSIHVVGGIAGELYGTLENCNVNQVFVRQPDYDTILVNKYNFGGMVGVWCATTPESAIMKNCHAVNVNLQTAGRCGGIVGWIDNFDIDYPHTFEDCSAREICLNDVVYPGYTNYYDYWHQCTGSIVGYVNTGEITFRNCSQSDCTYIFGYAKQENMVTLHTGDEGGNFTYTEPFTNQVVKVGPEHKFYGYSAVRDIIYHEE